MSFETLWAPWRLDYIKDPDRAESQKSRPSSASAETGEAADDCFLCRYRDNPANDAKQFVVLRGEHCFIVLNRFPYNNGHLLVAPLAHKGDITQISDAEAAEAFQLLRTMTVILRAELNAEGFNIGLNLGKTAGAGLPGHMHWHLVPRWNGDSNFMTVVGDTNVIPQSLAALHEILQTALKQ